MVSRRVLTGVCAAFLSGVFAVSSSAAEVRVINVSNDDAFVATAYKFWNGNAAVEGWTRVPSNKSAVVSAPDASDLYVRIEKAGGVELTYPGFNQFGFWPVHTERFNVGKSPLNAAIDVYRWGPELKQDWNIRRGDALPAGFPFQNKRFFRIGTGKHAFNVLP